MAPAAESGDIIDAEYVTLTSRTAARPNRSRTSRLHPSHRQPRRVAGMDMLRRRGKRRAARPARGGPLFWVLGVGLAVAAFWVSGGHALVRSAPFSAPTRRRARCAFPASPRASTRRARDPSCSSTARPPMTARRSSTCRRSTSRSPAMTAASPATGWGHRAARWRPAKHSPFPAGSTCLRTG